MKRYAPRIVDHEIDGYDLINPRLHPMRLIWIERPRGNQAEPVTGPLISTARRKSHDHEHFPPISMPDDGNSRTSTAAPSPMPSQTMNRVSKHRFYRFQMKRTTARTWRANIYLRWHTQEGWPRRRCGPRWTNLDGEQFPESQGTTPRLHPRTASSCAAQSSGDKIRARATL
jgi:hypothetical protein